MDEAEHDISLNCRKCQRPKVEPELFLTASRKRGGGFNWLTVLRKVLVVTFRNVLEGESRNCRQLTRGLKQS